MQQQQLNGDQEAPAEEPTTVPSPEEQMAAQGQEAPPEGAPMAPLGRNSFGVGTRNGTC